MTCITKIPKFRRFVLQNFPFIEQDFDALTDYQLICKVIEYLNTVIDSQNQVIDQVSALTDSFNELQSLVNELQSYVDNYFENLDVQDEVDHKLDEMVEDGTFATLVAEYFPNKLDDYSDSNRVSLGSNLLTDSSLWVTNSGWTENSSDSFTHILNETGDLEYNYSFEANKVYVVDFDITTTIPAGENASNDFTVVIGNTAPIVTYRRGGSMHYTIALKPSTAGSLKFKCVLHQDPYTASGLFQGTISNITLKEATGSLTQLSIKDGNDAVSVPFSVMLNANKTIAIGLDSGISNYNQNDNVYIGDESGKNDVTGYFNTAIGGKTLTNGINVTRCIAIGHGSLYEMESGDRNISIGTFSMTHNKYGRKNISIGYDTLNTMTNGEDNIALGHMAMVGTSATLNNQIAIGTLAMGASTHDGTGPNIALGRAAVYRVSTGNHNIGIGQSTLYKLTTGSNNIAIGTNALNQNETASGIIAIGTDGGSKVSSGTNSVFIGNSMGQSSLTTANRSIAIGTQILPNTVSITNTCLLGYNISANQSHTTLSNVVVINPGKYGVSIDRDNYLNIANVLFGDLTTAYQEKFGICVSNPTAYLHLAAGRPLASCAPLKFTSSDGSLLTTAEDGAMEYDGTHLYFTIGSTRHTIV